MRLSKQRNVNFLKLQPATFRFFIQSDIEQTKTEHRAWNKNAFPLRRKFFPPKTREKTLCIMNYCTIWTLNFRLKTTKGWVNTSGVNSKNNIALAGVRVQVKSNIAHEGSKVSFFHQKLKLFSRFVHICLLHHSTLLRQK